MLVVIINWTVTPLPICWNCYKHINIVFKTELIFFFYEDFVFGPNTHRIINNKKKSLTLSEFSFPRNCNDQRLVRLRSVWDCVFFQLLLAVRQSWSQDGVTFLPPHFPPLLRPQRGFPFLRDEDGNFMTPPRQMIGRLYVCTFVPRQIGLHEDSAKDVSEEVRCDIIGNR